jgi:phage terminase small subunit
MAALKNHKHEAFCLAVSSGTSGTQAYLSAGYVCTEGAAAVAANRLLKQPKIAARIAELAGRVAEVVCQKTGVTLAAVVDELAKIAFSNMLDYVRVGPDGDPYVDMTDLNRAQAAAIGEVVVEDFKDGRGEDARDVRRIRFKLLDKKGALVDLGRHLGGFVDRKEIGSPGEFESLTEDELRDKIRRADDLGGGGKGRRRIAPPPDKAGLLN